MKKVILSIGTLAIVALAVLNVNLTFNSESKVNVEFANMLSVAQNESGGGNCATIAVIMNDGCFTSVDYYCATGGNDYDCKKGFEENRECPPYNMWNYWEYVNCQ